MSPCTRIIPTRIIPLALGLIIPTRPDHPHCTRIISNTYTHALVSSPLVSSPVPTRIISSPLGSCGRAGWDIARSRVFSQAYSYSMSPLVVVMHAHIIPTHDCVSLKHSFKFFCKKFTARSRIILYPQSESYHPQSLSTHARASRADFLNGRITISKSKRRLARASRSARTYVHVYVGNPGQSYYIILTRII